MSKVFERGKYPIDDDANLAKGHTEHRTPDTQTISVLQNNNTDIQQPQLPSDILNGTAFAHTEQKAQYHKSGGLKQVSKVFERGLLNIDDVVFNTGSARIYRRYLTNRSLPCETVDNGV